VASRAGSRTLAAADAAAILAFVTIGLVSHHKGLGAAGYARDALPLLGGWFGAALPFRLYSARSTGRLAATWLAGVTAGVLVRALALGRSLDGKEAAFYAVALTTIGVLVLAFRGLVRLTRRWRRARRAAP
jgi:Protein of unknown function (DUF3054)